MIPFFTSSSTPPRLVFYQRPFPGRQRLINVAGMHALKHGGAVGSALGFGSKHPSSKLGRYNCVEALSSHHVTAVGKLLTLNCLGGDWPSFTFILTLLSSDCGMSVVSNKRILLLLLLLR